MFASLVNSYVIVFVKRSTKGGRLGLMLKLLADPSFPRQVLQVLNRAGIDAVRAQDIGASDLPPEELLRLASFEGRVLLTTNRSAREKLQSKIENPPSMILFTRTIRVRETSQLLLKLLFLFREDLADGALLVVSDSQTSLHKPIRPHD